MRLKVDLEPDKEDILQCEYFVGEIIDYVEKTIA